MLLLIALISIWTAEAFRSATPINIDRCRDHEWIHRDYIVYTCAVDGDVRTIKPFACDPTRGASTHLFLAPLAVNRTKYHDSFIYECKQNETDGSILFHAISCYPGNGVHLMKPGEVAAAKRGGTYFCYKDLDGILRLRYERPIHNHCDNEDPTDIACKMGTAETVYNSEYSHGRPFTIDVSTNVPKGPTVLGRIARNRVNGTKAVPRGFLVKAIANKISLDQFLESDRIGYAKN